MPARIPRGGIGAKGGFRAFAQVLIADNLGSCRDNGNQPEDFQV